MSMDRPEHLESEADLIRQMTIPSDRVRAAVGALDGDILILGVAGKMGPTLAELLVRAGARRVIGAARFSDASVQTYLSDIGVDTVKADLLDPGSLSSLPDAPFVVMMAGFKFGATGNESMTWAMNTWLPPLVVERYRAARIIYVSSGNVYAYTSHEGKGALEGGDIGPVGEYAQSRLGGERMVEYAAGKTGAQVLISRLFYATELRYGIIHDIGWRVWEGQAIDLTMGHVNQIWQGDANAYLAQSFPLCGNPPTVLNLTGAQVLPVREIATRLGEHLGRDPVFEGVEAESALLGDATQLLGCLGPPETLIDDVIRWTAHWIRIGGRSLGKPTKYESRKGEF